MHNYRKRFSILHVDDDMLDARLIRENLLSGVNDVDIHHVTKPLETIEHYKSYDAIILDYDLKSTVTGIDLALKIKTKFPSLPVVIITGMVSHDPRVTEIKNIGFDVVFKGNPLEAKGMFRQMVINHWSRPENDRRLLRSQSNKS